MAGRLAGKVALITGGASGIGEATAKLFAQEGAKVVVADVQTDKGKEVVKAIRAARGKAAFVKANVVREGDAKRMVAFTVKRYGRLDILFNNAGVENSKPEVETSIQEWDKVMDVNVKGVFLGTKYAVPEMKKSGGGSIINTSSIFGLIGSPGFAAYHASKGAVRLLTKSTALAHAGDQIREGQGLPLLTRQGLFERIADQIALAGRDARAGRCESIRRVAAETEKTRQARDLHDPVKSLRLEFRQQLAQYLEPAAIEG